MDGAGTPAALRAGRLRRADRRSGPAPAGSRLRRGRRGAPYGVECPRSSPEPAALPLETERIAPNRLRLHRRFAAPPERIYDAHLDPEIVRQWLFGPDGWTMPVCEIDARAGGGFRYEWRKEGGDETFSITGSFDALERPRRIVSREVMHLPDPTPENRIETRFEPDGSGTEMVMLMEVPDAKTMDAMLSTGMTGGMERSYARLDGIA